MNSSPIPVTPHAQKHQRSEAAVQAHSTLVSFVLGAQIFIDGTGRSVQQSGNAAYLAALIAVFGAALLHNLVISVRRRHDMRSLPEVYRAVWGRVAGNIACILTGVLFLCDVLSSLAALSALGSARLLPIQHQNAAFVPALAALGVAVYFAAVGLERLAFLSRRVVPVLLLVLSFLLVRSEPVDHLFPLLGESIPRTLRSACLATGASSCALASGFVPVSLKNAAEIPPVPRTKTLILAGLFSCALLLFVSLSAPSSALHADVSWAELLIHTGTYTQNAGLLMLSVVLLECFALFIALGGSLLLSVRVLSSVLPRRVSFILVFAFALAASAAITLCGHGFVLSILPLRFVPALLLGLLTLFADSLRRKRRKSA